MIIHHKEDFSEYDICILKSLKYSDTFTFIPIQLNKKETNKFTSNRYNKDFVSEWCLK